MAPDLSETQRRRLRDFFFGRVDRWRFCTQRDKLAQPLVPAKSSPRKRTTMFTHPEFECGGRDVEKAAVTWDCRPPADVGAAAAKAPGSPTAGTTSPAPTAAPAPHTAT